MGREGEMVAYHTQTKEPTVGAQADVLKAPDVGFMRVLGGKISGF